MKCELDTIEREKKNLECYVDVLKPEQAQVIRARFFEEKRWPQIEAEQGKTVKTLKSYMEAGITEMVKLNRYVASIRVQEQHNVYAIISP